MIIPEGADGTKFSGYCDNAHAGCIGQRTVRKWRGLVFCERCYRSRERLTVKLASLKRKGK